MIETILIYQFSNLSREEVQAMFGLDEFKQSRLYLEIKQEGKEEEKLESVPQLLAIGLTVEQLVTALSLMVEKVQAANRN